MVNELKKSAIKRTIGYLDDVGVKYRHREFTEDKVLIVNEKGKEYIRCIIIFDESERSKKLQDKVSEIPMIKPMQFGIYFEYPKEELMTESNSDIIIENQSEDCSPKNIETDKSTLAIAKEILDKKQGSLNNFIELAKKDTIDKETKSKYVERCNVIIKALTSFVYNIDMAESTEQIRPDLPILKNVDQRKDWIENYWIWGLWYYDQNIDCHYYKYDFNNGDRLVIEEYRDRQLYWKDDTTTEVYYHLLKNERFIYGKKKAYKEKYTHQTSSMTEIIEYLKELQKK